ncbi:T9SS type A sorting domain-containing protein [bacterium]|nr:T9SS type A sorting domain-containing protein [bacterium]
MSRRLILFFLLAFLPVSIFAIQFDLGLDEGIEFPETVVNETSTIEFIVSEPNDVQPVVVHIDQPEPEVFTIEPNEQVLRGGERIIFEVSFTPDEAGEIEGRLEGTYVSINGGRPVAFNTTLFGVAIQGENPAIEVHPLELVLELNEPGDSDEATADVGNSGEGDLEFEVIIADDCDWLEVDPEGGEIAGNSDQIIQLTFSTTNAVPDSGRYNAEVVISSNDPENEEVIVDVTLTVAYHPVPVIAVDAENIELSITELDQHVQETFIISNGGERTLEYQIAVPELPWIDVNPIAGELDPDSEQEIVVEGIHSGLPNGEYEAVLFINSNDPENSEISLIVRLVVNIEENVPRITLSDDTVRFEITEPEQQDIDTLIISNSGYQPLEILIVTLGDPDHMWYWIDNDSITIDPNSQFEFTIRTKTYLPENGERYSTFWINSNDPENEEVAVSVHLIVDINGITDTESILSQAFFMSESYPNPFNSNTTISFDLPVPVSVNLKIYDLCGREIAVIEEGWFKAGRYTAVWDAKDYPVGMYLCRMDAGGFRAARKVLLVK